jgi:hypothetical protein
MNDRNIDRGYTALALAICEQAIKDNDYYWLSTEYGKGVVKLALRYVKYDETNIDALLDKLSEKK